MKSDYEIKLYLEMNDEELEELYNTGIQDGSLKLTAYDAQISLALFLLFIRQVDVFGAVYNKAGQAQGLFYLNRFEGDSARIHFCPFKTGREKLDVLGKMVLEWCFAVFEFKSIVGIVPSIRVC